jgi:hypothetical protein
VYYSDKFLTIYLWSRGISYNVGNKNRIIYVTSDEQRIIDEILMK